MAHDDTEAGEEVKKTEHRGDSCLTYSAYDRCLCGEGLAYVSQQGMETDYWDCAGIITGRAYPSRHQYAVKHTDQLPFRFWSILPEGSPRVGHATTRPEPIGMELGD